MKKYWISWWTANTIEAGCIKPPFQCWVSGISADDNDESLCALVSAPNRVAIHKALGHYYPDYRIRFLAEVDDGYVPSDRFRPFLGLTSLEEE